jgi:hypothetical protein
MSAAEFLDRYFEPVVATLTPETAQALIALQPDESLAARVAELGRKSNAGTLTDVEREEYRVYVDAGDLVAILKAKARRALAVNRTG